MDSLSHTSNNPQPNPDYIRNILLELLRRPSPTGNASAALYLVEQQCQQWGLTYHHTRKGSLVATLPCAQRTDTEAVPATIATHVDTLGGMVSHIKSNGRLSLTDIGSYYPASVVGEYCFVQTASGGLIPGTVLLNKQSVHIHRRSEMSKLGEGMNDIEVRLDIRTRSRKETQAVGINVGDFVFWDPRAMVTESGFIKSRHLDNKAGVAAALGVAEMLVTHGLQTAQPTHLYFSTYEEVGHGGAAGIPADSEELLVIDMAPVGDGQHSDEFNVTICPKDGGGPYDLDMRRRLVRLAEQSEIPFHQDIYHYYASDGSAALFGGVDVRVGLIGPGVDASHAYERTHIDSIVNTARLTAAYLDCR